jgi:hypothetical protein
MSYFSKDKALVRSLKAVQVITTVCTWMYEEIVRDYERLTVIKGLQ